MAVPQSSAADDDYSVREIGRTLTDFRVEMRTQLAQLVRSDVYRAEREADRARIQALEDANRRNEDDRRTASRQAQGAIVAAVLSFLGSVVILMISLLVH